MDLVRALEVFSTIARHRSFADAARELRISTTSASRIILELENELGARLINRTTRQLSITDVGTIALERSRTLLTDIVELRASIHSLTNTAEGTPRATCPVTFGERVLTPIVASLMRHNPRLTVQLSLCNRYVDIVDEGFDVAIRQSPSLASSLVARKLCEVESVICAAPAYIKERGAPKEPADLSQHECVLYRSSLETFDSWHFQHPKRGAIRLKVESRLYVDSTSALREAVLSGAGIGLFPLYAVSAEIARGSLAALFGNLPVEPSLMHVVYPHRRYLSNKVRVFVDFLIANIELPTLRGSRASEGARN